MKIAPRFDLQTLQSRFFWLEKLCLCHYSLISYWQSQHDEVSHFCVLFFQLHRQSIKLKMVSNSMLFPSFPTVGMYVVGEYQNESRSCVISRCRCSQFSWGLSNTGHSLGNMGVVSLTECFVEELEEMLHYLFEQHPLLSTFVQKKLLICMVFCLFDAIQCLLSGSFIFFILFVLEYISKSASLPGYGRNGLHRVINSNK